MEVYENIDELKQYYGDIKIAENYFVTQDHKVFAYKQYPLGLIVYNTPIIEKNQHFVHKNAQHNPRDGMKDIDDPLLWFDEINPIAHKYLRQLNEYTRRAYELHDPDALKIALSKKSADEQIARQTVEIDLPTNKLAEIIPGISYLYNNEILRAAKLMVIEDAVNIPEDRFLLYNDQSAYRCGNIRLPVSSAPGGALTKSITSFRNTVSNPTMRPPMELTVDEIGNKTYKVTTNRYVIIASAKSNIALPPIKPNRIIVHPLTTKIVGKTILGDDLAKQLINCTIYIGPMPDVEYDLSKIGDIYVGYNKEQQELTILIPHENVHIAFVHDVPILTIANVNNSDESIKEQNRLYQEILERIKQFHTDENVKTSAVANLGNELRWYINSELVYRKTAELEEGNPPEEEMTKELKPQVVRIVIMRRLPGGPINIHEALDRLKLLDIAPQFPSFIRRLLMALGLGSGFKETIGTFSDKLEILHAARDEIGRILLDAKIGKSPVKPEDAEKAFESINTIIDQLETE